ncbi:hypothetical protein [Leisingera sp. M658]|uniref:hypothetical protein n=1 Tax=Leisingera sp. M658 TaxID=2867015 RepID=UPI0021A6F2F7|nr:hypothetical protein [Leisingera sp. M658]UWQ73602.1 hypothetical protein K3724_13710 [Leisingera sp. M658]
MIARKRLFAKGILTALALCPQLSAANGFTSADVLQWEQSAQDSMFQTSIGMLAVVASQMDDKAQLAECIDDWYFADPSAKPARNGAIREAMEKFPDYHPQIILFAVVEKECGKF